MVKINLTVVSLAFVMIVTYLFAGFTGLVIALIVGLAVTYFGNYNLGSFELKLKGNKKKK